MYDLVNSKSENETLNFISFMGYLYQLYLPRIFVVPLSRDLMIRTYNMVKIQIIRPLRS